MPSLLIPLAAMLAWCGVCQPVASPGATAPRVAAAGPRVSAKTAGARLDILVDDGPFTSFLTRDVAKPSLFPLLAPGGQHVSRGYPLEPRPNEERDHPHHTSLWFAHGDVNGHDFWHAGKGERIVPTAEPAAVVHDDHVEVTASFEWRAPDATPVCTEHRVMRFRAAAQSRTIDFDLTLTASSGPLTFGDTKEGTFALRLAPELRLKGPVAKGSILSSTGERNGACWGKRAAWVEYAGPVGGTPISVAIFDHPQNPRHPTWWHARDYGLFAANPFGRHDFEGAPAGAGKLTVAAGDSVRFRYRLVITEGARSAPDLDAAFNAYAKDPAVDQTSSGTTKGAR